MSQVDVIQYAVLSVSTYKVTHIAYNTEQFLDPI